LSNRAEQILHICSHVTNTGFAKQTLHIYIDGLESVSKAFQINKIGFVSTANNSQNTKGEILMETDDKQ
jgi:hypothetical protein